MYQEAHKTLCKAWEGAFTLSSKELTAISNVEQKEKGYRIILSESCSFEVTSSENSDTLLEVGLL